MDVYRTVSVSSILKQRGIYNLIIYNLIINNYASPHAAISIDYVAV